MSFHIHFSSPAEEGLAPYLVEGLSKHAKEKRGLAGMSDFSLTVKNNKDEVKGGLDGILFYGYLYVGNLYIDAAYRGQNIGTELMHKAEAYGRSKGCRFSTVNTMDFEALDFYKKLGYCVDLERHGFDGGSVFYFLIKEL